MFTKEIKNEVAPERWHFCIFWHTKNLLECIKNGRKIMIFCDSQIFFAFAWRKIAKVVCDYPLFATPKRKYGCSEIKA